MNRRQHNKIVAKTITMIWSSLDSHLSETYNPTKFRDKRAKEILGTSRFHIQCVKEYAEIIRMLSELL